MVMPSSPADVDPGRFETRFCTRRGFRQAYLREGAGGPAVLLVHGWPETKRIYWRVVEPLVEAGFEVIVPDLRGFGDSDVAPDGFGDVASSSHDLYALVHDELGHDRVLVVGGDLGGPVIQDLALRFPGLVERMVLFNAPLPVDREAMADLQTLAVGTHDYFFRQGTDADALAAELATPDQRRRYVATFYSSRLWAHPGAFDDDAIAFHAEPFGDGARLRASFKAYESVFDRAQRSERPLLATNPAVRAVVLFGPSDHVISPDFDRMAAVVFPDHVGPFLLRDCGHFVPWEAPHALVSAIVSLAGAGGAQ